MNKKLMLFILPLFSLLLVSAAVITYYGQVQQTVTVEQAVILSGGNCDENFCSENIPETMYSGDTLISNLYSVKNFAESPRDMKLSTSSNPWTAEGEITTSYIGILELTKKDITTWEPIEDKLEITYTLIGDSFEATGIPEGYTLIYYKDEVVGLEGRLENPQPAIIVTSDIGSLPQEDDANIDDLANYCEEPDNYLHCKGAKLWVVLEEDIINGNLNWANMENYYYETDLIVYSDDSEGKITLPAGGGFNFRVVNEFDTTGFEGDIITEVLPITA